MQSRFCELSPPSFEIKPLDAKPLLVHHLLSMRMGTKNSMHNLKVKLNSLTEHEIRK
jgi:hypothetical protein